MHHAETMQRNIKQFSFVQIALDVADQTRPSPNLCSRFMLAYSKYPWTQVGGSRLIVELDGPPKMWDRCVDDTFSKLKQS